MFIHNLGLITSKHLNNRLGWLEVWLGVVHVYFIKIIADHHIVPENMSSVGMVVLLSEFKTWAVSVYCMLLYYTKACVLIDIGAISAEVHSYLFHIDT